MSTSPQPGPWPGPERKAPSAPKELAAEGRAAWRRLTTRYDFAPHELDLLREYCLTLDVLARLRQELAAGDLTVLSPQAGPVANRMLAEIRSSQAELRKLAEALNFPDPAAGLPSARGTSRRDPRSHRRAG